MTKKLTLIPIMLSFFCMGFVDLVGIASNYVKQDLALSDSTANIFPSLVFFWFLIFSVPTGMLMNRIGRKNTVVGDNVGVAVDTAVWQFVCRDADCVFTLGHWQRADADITQPVGFHRFGRQKPCVNTHFRTICKGNCIVFSTLHRHLGSHAGDS